MDNMCYHLNFMSKTEPCKADTSYIDFLKCTVGALVLKAADRWHCIKVRNLNRTEYVLK